MLLDKQDVILKRIKDFNEERSSVKNDITKEFFNLGDNDDKVAVSSTTHKNTTPSPKKESTYATNSTITR